VDPNLDQQMLEAILTAVLQQHGGTARLSVPGIALASSAFRIRMETDWEGQTLTLSLEPDGVPAAPPPRRCSRPRRLRSRTH
jgi:hypothetical protein